MHYMRWRKHGNAGKVNKPGRPMGWDRRGFDRSYGKGASNRLIVLLQKDCNNFSEIARRFDLSRERIRQIAATEYLSIKPGFERRKSCTLSRPHFLPGFKYPLEVLYIWREARKRGMTVVPHTEPGLYYALKWIIDINGIPCKVCRCGKPWKFSGTTSREYYHLSFRSDDNLPPFAIAVCGLRREVFIIPREAIVGNFPPSGRRRYVFIPIAGWAHYRNHSPRIDWLQFKDRWELLRPVELTEVEKERNYEDTKEKEENQEAVRPVQILDPHIVQQKEEAMILNLPWRLIVTATGGVVLDSRGCEVAFCDRGGAEQMKAGIEMLNARGAYLSILNGGGLCQSGESGK